MDPATLARHALEALKRPLTQKEALSSVADFRIDRRKKFPLYEILMIAVCAMIDGAKGPTDFERFGKAKLRLLKKFLPSETASRATTRSAASSGRSTRSASTPRQ